MMFFKFFINFILFVSILIKVNNCESSAIKNIENLFANGFETLEKLLEVEMNNLYYSRDSEMTKEDLFKPEILDLESYNRSICDLFSTPRNHLNPTQKLEFQKKLKAKLLSYGYDNVFDQVFRVRYLENRNDKDELQYELGRNIIATLNGKYSEESKHIQRVLLKKIINLRSNKIDKKIFNETITEHDMAVIEENFISKQKDKIVVVGAHYDTLNNVIGIEDNASASFAVLELARLLRDYRFKLNYTIVFVWFDFEEIGALGSFSFVNHFLIPNYLKKENFTFLGAIIMDMLLNINKQQKIEQIEKIKTSPSIQLNKDDVYQDVTLNDSISIWFRNHIDVPFANQLVNSFNQNELNDITLLPVKLDFQNLNNKNESLFKNRFYLGGDHFSFWLPNKNYSSFNLPTVFLTNMALWRKGISSPMDCYHKACDDHRQLTKDNLMFLNKMIYLLRDVLINLDD